MRPIRLCAASLMFVQVPLVCIAEADCWRNIARRRERAQDWANSPEDPQFLLPRVRRETFTIAGWKRSRSTKTLISLLLAGMLNYWWRGVFRSARADRVCGGVVKRPLVGEIHLMSDWGFASGVG